jgi:hypothetical protein
MFSPWEDEKGLPKLGVSSPLVVRVMFEIDSRFPIHPSLFLLVAIQFEE